MSERYIIAGKIQNRTDEPMPGLLVKAFDVDRLSNDDFLGEGTTDRNGRFTVKYRNADFVKNILEYFIEGGPDLVLKVYDPTGNLLHTTSLRSGASRFESYLIELDNLFLSPGDILISDPKTNAIIHVNPASGNQLVVSSGGLLNGPGNLVPEADGCLLVLNPGNSPESGIIRVNPDTGEQTKITEFSEWVEAPNKIAMAADGEILLVHEKGIIRVDPATGARLGGYDGILSETVGRGIASEPSGDILVAQLNSVTDGREIVRINPGSAAMESVSSGNLLKSCLSLGVDNVGNILALNASSPGLNNGEIIRVKPDTGDQISLTSGLLLADPSDLALNSTGSILVATGNSSTITGQVIRVNPNNGVQEVVSSGGSLRAPTGIAIVPGLDLHPGDLLTVSMQEGAIYKVDPVTGGQVRIVIGGLIKAPNGITVDNDGNILVVNCGTADSRIIRINPRTGIQIELVGGGVLEDPDGIIVAPNDDIFVATEFAVKKVNPATGEVTSTDLVEGGDLTIDNCGGGIAYETAGTILVKNFYPFEGGQAQILRLDPAARTQTVVSSGGELEQANGHIVVESTGKILTCGPHTSGVNDGKIVQIDPVSGAQTIRFSGNLLVSPHALVLDGAGNLFVADGAGVIKMDSFGTQTTISSGGLFNRLDDITIFK